MALLDVRDLTVTFPGKAGPAHVLDGVSFSVAPGEAVGIVGESGCGKSMTALAVMGLLPPGASVRGHIRLGADDLLTLPEPALCDLRGRRIAMIFQEPMTALNPVRTIGDQVGEGLALHLALGRRARADRVRELLDRVGLPAPRFAPSLYPHELSGGQRQRVMIAIALACEPDLLIADEPTTALDVTTEARILDLILEVTAASNMALVMITHDLGIVAETAERVLVMYAGRIVEEGTAERLFAGMAHPYTAGLFAASPHAVEIDPDVRRPRLAAIPGTVPEPGERTTGCPFAGRCPRRTPACIEPPPRIALAEGHGVACFHPLAAGEGVR
ncbi:peptide/nickel transport system ATP-binding protein [Rhodobium orientis]|uniref:ABC transporter ATP-binding protein n=1 Tax=Rhodobium orientis TaxID=34017 RepID=A0A327JEL4_9HYPH|nr:ABC transporter ATP-binding protein [Rhodobium orientis]MBB4305631.1 peptide/nickel transport system ATP-binding protein [Rhodobium orientis]MBK5948712.1 ABC transporter ATP-binding protein [Rhodobium orientis]RAI23870.1 ABC transporter ATP-binding protein [Rhodobium orientis]